MSDNDGIDEAIWPVATHMPLGGFDSSNFFEALRNRPVIEEVPDGLCVRLASALFSVVNREDADGPVDEGGMFWPPNTGNGSVVESLLSLVSAIERGGDSF
jgi:hypothetical protein